MNKFKTTIINALNLILPNSLKKSLFHLSFHLARSEFDRFSYDYNYAPNMEFGMTAIAERGFVPRTIVDVGAFEGHWSAMARKIWPDSRILMFEANSSKQARLKVAANKINASHFCELLGAEDDAIVSFNIMESGSSVFSERSPIERSTEVRKLRRLDSILKDIEGPAFLKIDTQGYELEVLKGSQLVLPSIDGILLEIAIIEINEGAPLLNEVTAYLKSIGFLAYDILEIHRRPLDKALNQVDILFLRENSHLVADKRHYA